MCSIASAIANTDYFLKETKLHARNILSTRVVEGPKQQKQMLHKLLPCKTAENMEVNP